MPELTRAQIQALVPHAGSMCLLDRVLAWDAEHIHCRSDRYHRDAAHPLRRGGRLAAVNLVEYGAQAAAVHAGLVAVDTSAQRPRAGFLAALRDVQLWAGDVSDLTAPLDVHAYRQMGGQQGMIYRFAVAHEGATEVSGRLTIMLAS